MSDLQHFNLSARALPRLPAHYRVCALGQR